jgi:hypothetical protein
MRISSSSAPLGFLMLCACGGEGGGGGGGGSPAFEVVADDGSATLQVPEGALPDGVAPEALSIRRLDADQGLLEAEGFEPIATWDLLPHGLVFSEPARFEVRPDVVAAGMLMVLHTWSDGAELLEMVDLLVSEDGRIESFAVEVDHFSQVRFAKSPLTTTFTLSPTPTVVGGPTVTTVEATVVAPTRVLVTTDAFGVATTHRLTVESSRVRSLRATFRPITSNLSALIDTVDRANPPSPERFTGAFFCTAVGRMRVNAQVTGPM